MAVLAWKRALELVRDLVFWGQRAGDVKGCCYLLTSYRPCAGAYR